jgi:hypothetical protein
LIFGFLGRWVALQCGRNGNEGFWLGFLFGPFGAIIEGLLPKFPNDKRLHDSISSNRASEPPDAVVRDEKAVPEWLRTH